MAAENTGNKTNPAELETSFTIRSNTGPYFGYTSIKRKMYIVGFVKRHSYHKKRVCPGLLYRELRKQPLG